MNMIERDYYSHIREICNKSEVVLVFKKMEVLVKSIKVY